MRHDLLAIPAVDVWHFRLVPSLERDFGSVTYNVEGMGDVRCSFFEKVRATSLSFTLTDTDSVAAIDAKAQVRLVKINKPPKRTEPRHVAWYEEKMR